MTKIDEIKVMIDEQEPDKITISVAEPEVTSIEVEVEPIPTQRISLDIRRTLDNNYIVYDHPLFDIIVNPDKKKIMTFEKKKAKTPAYPHQDAFFDYLKRRGVILADTVKGGNIFGSIEATYPANKKIDVVKTVLLNIFTFFRDELPKLKSALDYDFETDRMLVDPDAEDSTEYGEVPQQKKKGTMDPFYTQYYGLLYRI
jgi:hypothetical protein